VVVDDAKMSEPVKVLFTCTGVGIYNRGIESFFREAFNGLKSETGIEARLIKGAGESKEDEWVVANLPRTGRLAPAIGKLARRNAYVVEQWSSFPAIVRRIRKFRPQVIFYSDSNLGFLLYWFRRQIGVPYRLLFSNGGPCHPPFVRTDYVQQVAPYYYQEALDYGESPAKHFLVPYGINVCSPPKVDTEKKRKLRASLNLPNDRPVVLSVGWVARQHKRMDYLISEVAHMPEPRPFLQLLGAIDENSAEIISLGYRLLGEENFNAVSVPYEQVANYYRAADVFALASLKEGFGRVYLEAMMHGLPVMGHRHPVIEYVIGEQGVIADLKQPQSLARALQSVLSEGQDEEAMQRRWESIRDRFSWNALAPAYEEMFRKVSMSPLPA
jgi:glycosyltransferase involved in cell wall biosynthesis